MCEELKIPKDMLLKIKTKIKEIETSNKYSDELKLKLEVTLLKFILLTNTKDCDLDNLEMTIESIKDREIIDEAKEILLWYYGNVYKTLKKRRKESLRNSENYNKRKENK